ncbi:GspI family T2SS minor pseudopilin variant LspI [Legionella sp. CNM-4043-24]|uniref:GspI family T2SS minor pseudopilin variant LspI n=1 Tax=Legionella sp. CNM-4043-24 TaxID=3421646 RepID=UPI00403AEEE1
MTLSHRHDKQGGFTLVEVLIALTIIAIALTALLKSTAQTVSSTQRLKEKNISHWVAMQGVSMLQLGLVTTRPNEEMTQVTELLNQKWYWRVKITPTPIKAVDMIVIRVSRNQSGPFTSPLTAFRFAP